ncbi:hypothetical protein AVEN_172930-1 [Araneus ventricosus]|uniref:Uncharacterized protein n=1 Tax=Araneus ventricosus TaxID=182803 RepID=A0A4Y2WVG2_ARAVE|nr:hypothetical protein AVEN_103931-1 [Araneus ventricosus]GBO41363.1 hypothetical protein AVEN_172930-1 [Araneus ventricosus]
MFSVAKKLFKTFVAAFASAVEGPGSSCSSSISEDESTIELLFFFSFTNARISSSLTSPADQKIPPPSLVDTRPGVHWGGRGDRNCKEPCLLFLCPTYGVSSDSNKVTIG